MRAGSDQQQQPQAPVFRSTIALVPVDVRVTDKDGKPVTDLRPDEFTILEDGKRQDVRHFTLQLFTPRTQAPGAALALRESAISLEPQANRIFLIVLGRGRLQEPSKAVDGIIRFVRELLLPQDAEPDGVPERPRLEYFLPSEISDGSKRPSRQGCCVRLRSRSCRQLRHVDPLSAGLRECGLQRRLETDW